MAPLYVKGQPWRGGKLAGGGFGLWLVRRAGVRGQAGHAGLQSRPRVPSHTCRLTAFLIGEHTGVDDVRQRHRKASDYYVHARSTAIQSIAPETRPQPRSTA
jgi:hypothetical protein